jgi:hypothetical protein
MMFAPLLLQFRAKRHDVHTHGCTETTTTSKVSTVLHAYDKAKHCPDYVHLVTSLLVAHYTLCLAPAPSIQLRQFRADYSTHYEL